MYELDGARRRLAFTQDNIAETAETWTADLIDTWFAMDPTKALYHVPQVMCYQPGGIVVDSSHLEPGVGEAPLTS